VEHSFEGSKRTRELIQLPTMNDPRPGGRASPGRWWGFSSVYLFVSFFPKLISSICILFILLLVQDLLVVVVILL
jgi:hypothetical protein